VSIKVGVIGPFIRQPDGRYSVDIFRDNKLLHFELEPDFDPNLAEPKVIKMRCFQIGSHLPFKSVELREYSASV